MDEHCVRTVADLLQQLIRKESDLLAAEPITHGPTIGDMYEGLSLSTLECAFVNETETPLFFGNGFIRYPDGTLSPQLDCVVAINHSGRIPGTEKYYFNQSEVIAVFEIKKNAYKDDLVDGYRRMSKLSDYPFGPPDEVVDTYFAYMTGLRIDAGQDKLTGIHRLVWRVLNLDMSTPLRVVWGYNGYSSHDNFRNAVLNAVLEVAPNVTDLDRVPAITISGPNVAVREDGLPWTSQMIDSEWPYLSSHTGVAPIYFILEALWTRVRLRFGEINELRGSTLRLPILKPLLGFRPDGDSIAVVPHAEIQRRCTELAVERKWSPEVYSEDEFIAFSMLLVPDLRDLIQAQLDGGMPRSDPPGPGSLKVLEGLWRKRLTSRGCDAKNLFMPLADDNVIVRFANDLGFRASEPGSTRFFRWASAEWSG